MFRSLAVRLQAATTHYLHERGTRGVTMLEYVLLGLMVVMVGLVLWRLFGSRLRDAFAQLGDAIS